METEAVLALYDVEQRINIEYPGVRKERRPHVIRYVSEAGGPHFISACGAAAGGGPRW